MPLGRGGEADFVRIPVVLNPGLLGNHFLAHASGYCAEVMIKARRNAQAAKKRVAWNVVHGVHHLLLFVLSYTSEPCFEIQIQAFCCGMLI